MGEVIEFNRKRFFTLNEARDLLPVVRRITGTTQNKIKALNAQISLLNVKSKRSPIEERVRSLFECWKSKMHKLGCEPKGMWLVDFDSGSGFYCWHYPESDISYYHGYLDGFIGRTRLQ